MLLKKNNKKKNNKKPRTSKWQIEYSIKYYSRMIFLQTLDRVTGICRHGTEDSWPKTSQFGQCIWQNFDTANTIRTMSSNAEWKKPRCRPSHGNIGIGDGCHTYHTSIGLPITILHSSNSLESPPPPRSHRPKEPLCSYCCLMVPPSLSWTLY